MAADLHCHTRRSDGAAEVREVVELAARLGLRSLAVTDHDTFAGCEEALHWGKRLGVRILPGAELSTRDAATGRKAHILCYGCPHPERLEPFLQVTRENRSRAVRASLEQVRELLPLPEGMAERRAETSTGMFVQHIMHALLDAGLADGIFGETYRRLFHPETGLVYQNTEYPETREAIRRVREAGGLAVLAHPAVYDCCALLEELVREGGIDGVEVWHPRNRPGDAERLAALAEEHHLAVSGGTDFHSMYTHTPQPLGTCTAPDAAADRLAGHGR